MASTPPKEDSSPTMATKAEDKEIGSNRLSVPSAYGPDGVASTNQSSLYSLDKDHEKQSDKEMGAGTGNKEGHREEEHEEPSVDEKAKTGQEQIGAPLEAVESSDYPRVGKLVFILIAVSLSVFLVALDMVLDLSRASSRIA